MQKNGDSTITADIFVQFLLSQGYFLSGFLSCVTYIYWIKRTLVPDTLIDRIQLEVVVGFNFFSDT